MVWVKSWRWSITRSVDSWLPVMNLCVLMLQMQKCWAFRTWITTCIWTGLGPNLKTLLSDCSEWNHHHAFYIGEHQRGWTWIWGSINVNTHSVTMSVFSCTAIVPFLGRGKRLWYFIDPHKCVEGVLSPCCAGWSHKRRWAELFFTLVVI